MSLSQISPSASPTFSQLSVKCRFQLHDITSTSFSITPPTPVSRFHLAENMCLASPSIISHFITAWTSPQHQVTNGSQTSHNT